MTKEELLKAMQNHVLQLKLMGERGSIIREGLLKLNEEDAKWYEEKFKGWLAENGMLKQE